MAGRHGPALFELIRGSSQPTPAAPAPQPAAPRPLPEVRAKPVEPQPEPSNATDRPAPAWRKPGAILDPNRAVTIPMSTVLIGFAVVMVLLLITWAAAYKLAHNRGENQAAKDLGLNGTSDVKEPSATSIPVNPDLVKHDAKSPDPRPPVVPEKQTTPAKPDSVPAGTDPRVAGLNYYILASGLDKDAGQKMADFLTENGLQSAAVVDRKASGANNPGSCVVFVTRGIRPDEYKTRAAARTEVETQVVRLGKAWKQDRKGKTDFSQAYWQRYSN